MRYTQLELAVLRANEIEKFIKEKYPNLWIRKTSLRFKFDMHPTLASLVWCELERRGFLVEHKTLKWQQPQEQPQQPK